MCPYASAGFDRQGLNGADGGYSREPTCEARPQLTSGLKSVEIHALVFHRPPQALDKTLSIQRPRPSMLIRTSASRSTLVKAWLVN
jgi:hypothetical protein